MSHEIRTPLNAINGFNDILNTPGIEISAEERADLLARIAENIKAITNIVDEMLQMADKESNEFYDKTDRIYCNNFFSNLLYSHREHVSSSIELEYVPRVINRFQIETNEEGLRKVMEELIQNAIKFTSKGYIRVSCQLSDDNYQLLVSIEDSGRGIPKEEQEKIFEGFYKTNAFEQGIGLGLTVSKKIAQKLGGDLTLDTKYIGGARFVLSLPA
jgi:signal transduction histidine kinase